MKTSIFGRSIELARRRPGAILAWVLGIHLVVWTMLPMLVCANLGLDLVEDLALGKEWQLGYWKHPPLPWWLADVGLPSDGQVDVVYLLGPLSAVACLYAVWRLAREVVEPELALAAVLTLEGLHFFNFSAVKFAHDQMQLPFWALTGWFVYRAITRQRMSDWIAAGAFLALAFWSKYAAFALAGTIGWVLLFDPVARRSWRGAGPYAMAATFLIVLAPNLWWLAETGFQPFHYVDERAIAAVHWYDYLAFPLRWSAGQIFFLIPTILLLATLFPPWQRPRLAAPKSSFDRRYVTALAIGPFAITTLVALLLGRLPVAMWGYPLWSFAPLAVLMWLKPSTDQLYLRRFAAGFVVIFVAMPAIYAGVEVFESLLRDRPRADLFPGRQLAETVTRQWTEKTGTVLHYVGGTAAGHGPGEFAANNIAVYSADRPHVIVHGDLSLSPWVDPADLKRRGALFAWQPSGTANILPPDIAEAFPGAQLQPPVTLPQASRYSRQNVTIHYAILPPKP